MDFYIILAIIIGIGIGIILFAVSMFIEEYIENIELKKELMEKGIL